MSKYLGRSMFLILTALGLIVIGFVALTLAISTAAVSAGNREIGTDPTVLALIPSPPAKGAAPNLSPPTAVGKPLSKFTGVPAVQPHLNLNDSTKAAFDEADIRQFVLANRVGVKIIPTSAFSIEKVEFLTKKEIGTQIGDEGTELPDNDLQCLVTLKGTFTVRSPNVTSITYSKAYEIFDARTGNKLVSELGN